MGKWRKFEYGLHLAIGMLFLPEFKQERRHCTSHHSRSSHNGMTGWAQGDHQVHQRSSRSAVMNDN